jgi:hypothetical protein
MKSEVVPAEGKQKSRQSRSFTATQVEGDTQCALNRKDIEDISHVKGPLHGNGWYRWKIDP